jgi:predicted ABC-type ATPase
VIQFVNGDLIAQGLAPFDPRLAAVPAGRLLLREVSRLAGARTDFALESTLSGIGYARHLANWKRQGYRIEMVYLGLKSSQLAFRRIAARVRQGGHYVPRPDVLRRFKRGWEHFVGVCTGRWRTNALSGPSTSSTEEIMSPDIEASRKGQCPVT